MNDREGVDIDDFNGATTSRLNSSELDEVRDLLTKLPRLEETLHALQRDQTNLTESVAAFATRVERRHHESTAQAGRTHQLLQEVIQQMQQFSDRSYATMESHSRQLNEMRGEIEQMKSDAQAQREEVADLRATITDMSSMAGPNAVDNSELYPEWDVLGKMPEGTTSYSANDLEDRIAKTFKQKETPIFGGEDNEDIDVYVLNMISWYGAFQLFFRQPQVDFRVGQLMMSHTKGKAKAWLLQEYSGEWRWSSIAKKMRQRFLTKSREEDRVARLFDCTQRCRSLDEYIEEFLRLARTEEVSVKFKLILFKKGLQSQDLQNFLQTKQYTSLEDLVDAARTMNPRAAPEESNKRAAKSASAGSADGGKSRKGSQNKCEKKTDTQKCTPMHCTEQGHTPDKCWMFHPELQPKWLKSKKNNAATTTSATSNSVGMDQLLKMMSSLKSDMDKLKSDLN